MPLSFPRVAVGVTLSPSFPGAGTAKDSEDEEEERDEGQKLMFLQAIYLACLAAQDRGQDTLEPHCCKVAVVERIVELIEELPDDSPPGTVLANSLIAVGNLSTMTLALETELETHLLHAALHSVFTLGTEKDTTQVQDLHRLLPDVLDAMLGNLLAKSPETNRLHYILEEGAPQRRPRTWSPESVSGRRLQPLRHEESISMASLVSSSTSCSRANEPISSQNPNSLTFFHSAVGFLQPLTTPVSL
ncbi:uncharacterized protein LOC120393127 [Mauremys reevesii]|uniref:uncharacterized protein LOC120393127 n=1 Tax=Mauremys reevesii TaxID=260615 RepID=UPI00193FD0DF|nr:uncharacterized protein LOC120393127 [Mauremys reevesii]